MLSHTIILPPEEPFGSVLQTETGLSGCQVPHVYHINDYEAAVLQEEDHEKGFYFDIPFPGIT